MAQNPKSSQPPTEEKSKLVIQLFDKDDPGIHDTSASSPAADRYIATLFMQYVRRYDERTRKYDEQIRDLGAGIDALRRDYQLQYVHQTSDDSPSISDALSTFEQAVEAKDEVAIQVELSSLRIAIKSLRKKQPVDSHGRIALTYLYDALVFTPQRELVRDAVEKISVLRTGLSTARKTELTSEELSALYDALEGASFELIPQTNDHV